MPIDVEHRLEELGDLLALDDSDLSSAVAGALAARRVAANRVRPATAVAAVVLAAVVAAVSLLPSARATVAGWLGLDRVEIERRDDLVVPPTAPAITAPAITVPATSGPLGERVVTVDGTPVLLGTLDGRLTDVFITKSISGGAAVEALDIDGMPAVWVAEPHELVIERAGQPVVERIAGSTLLWQDGDVLWRVEGFTDRADAIAFARARDR